MNIFWDIVFRRVGDSLEETGRYEDVDAARADYLYMTQEHPEDYEYVCLRQIETDYNAEEDITQLDIWYAE